MNEEEKFWKAHEELLSSDDDSEPFNHAAYEDAQYEYMCDLERDD